MTAHRKILTGHPSNKMSLELAKDVKEAGLEGRRGSAEERAVGLIEENTIGGNR